MSILINQPAGLGDIIFSMSMVRALSDEYGDVLWPVQQQWVEGLRRAYPDIKWIDQREVKIDYERKDNYEYLGMWVLPLRFAHEKIKKGAVDFMRAKYEAYNDDWQDWMEDGEFERDENMETALCSRYRATALHRPYVIINNTYKSDGSGKAPFQIKVDDAIDYVYMEAIPGYSLFDWSKLLLNAKEIHTVGTSLIYILELIEPTCPIYIYPRLPQHRDHRRYDYILRSCDYRLMP